MEGETNEVKITRRYAILQVTPEFLVALSVGTSIKTVYIKEHALPLDARIVGVGPMNPIRQTSVFDASHGLIGILVESETFEDIPPGLPLPILPPPNFKLLEEAPPLSEIESKCPSCGASGAEGLKPAGANNVCRKCSNCGWQSGNS